MGTVPTLKSGLEFLLTRNSDVKKRGASKKGGEIFPQKPAPKHPLYWYGNPPKAEIVPPDQVGWSGIIYVLRVRRASEYECARLVSPRAFCPPHSNHLFGGDNAGEIGAVRGGIVVLRTRFAGKEQAIVYRRGQRASARRLTGQSIGIGAAGERIAAPAMKPERFHPAGEITAEQAGQLGHSKVDERSFPRRLELSREPTAEIGLDLRPAERPEVIDPGSATVGAAKQSALLIELSGIG